MYQNKKKKIYIKTKMNFPRIARENNSFDSIDFEICYQKITGQWENDKNKGQRATHKFI